MSRPTPNLSESDNHVYKNGYLIRYVLSTSSALVAETVTFPLDIIKTRIQLHSGSEAQGFWSVAKSIAKDEGFGRFWSGLSPAFLRHLTYTGLRMVFYEEFRDKLFKEREFTLVYSVIGGLLAGAVAQVLTSPADLVKVKMQAEARKQLKNSKTPIKNTSIISIFNDVYKKQGIKGLWRGVGVNSIRASLVCMGDITGYDFTKKFLLRELKFKDDYKVHLLSSISSNVLAVILGNPGDVVRSRIMAQKHMGEVYLSSWQCILITYKNEGIRGFYKGAILSWTRMAPWSITFWMTYEEIRRIFGLSSF